MGFILFDHDHTPKPTVVLMNPGRWKLHISAQFPNAGLPKNRWFVLSFRVLAWIALYYLPLHCVSFSNLRGYCVYGNAPSNSSLVCWRSFLDVVNDPHFWVTYLKCRDWIYIKINKPKLLVGVISLRTQIPRMFPAVGARTRARTALGPAETFDMAEQTGFSHRRVFVATILLPSLYFLLYVAFVTVQLCLPGRVWRVIKQTGCSCCCWNCCNQITRCMKTRFSM